MELRTNERHAFPIEEATSLQYKVNALPTMDFAAKALHDQQARYFTAHPEAKKYAHCLIWTIEPE